MRYKLPSHIDTAHPVVQQEYAVYTPPIDEMVTKIGDWIVLQIPGGYIYGASRLGKSRGIKWHVRSVLQDRFDSSIPLVVWNHRPDIHTSEANFWNELLIASKFYFADPCKPPKKNEGIYLFTQRLVSIARTAKRNYVVLLIDEAQDITLREWKWLVGLQNQLDWDGIRLSIFSVGSHQMGYRHEMMAVTGNAHIAARFLVAHARFHGLCSVEELSYVLQGYDTASEWPEGSGITYLQYFAPDNFARGDRLANSSNSIWQALVSLVPGGRNKMLEFPMQHVSHAVENILFRLANGEFWENATSYDSWFQAISETGFSDHMRIITN